jgi:hypothetical protein
MKQRMYNNYDGYMYSVHERSLGSVVYKNRIYILDDEADANKLLTVLEEDNILTSKVFLNEYYYETQYKIHSTYLEVTFIDKSIQRGFHQVAPTLLNIRTILALHVSTLVS